MDAVRLIEGDDGIYQAHPEDEARFAAWVKQVFTPASRDKAVLAARQLEQRFGKR